MRKPNADRSPDAGARARTTRAASPAARLALAFLATTGAASVLGPASLAGLAAPAALYGTVVDARTGGSVAGAAVVLEPESAGAFPATSPGGSFMVSARTATTDRSGRYRFGDLSPGAYRLYVSSLGYRPYSVVVEIGGGAASVSIGLEAAPIALEPIRGEAVGGGPYVSGDAFGTDSELGRLLAAELRRRRFLTTDVRELTHADVVEGITLGEPDVFRALQRLPGVTTRSDYTAELWTRGAPWSHTRVYFDGVPVYNPLHALGVLSGISSSALGTVWFYPGVRPSGIGEGSAGVIDLRSRPGTGSGQVNARGELSLMTAGLALDQRVLDGRAGWMVSARRSYLDWLTQLASRATRGNDEYPYGFAEVTGNVDLRLGGRHTLEGSWLWEGDELRSDAGTADPVRAVWGNAVGRATWTAGLGGVHVQHTVAGSGHHGRLRSEDMGTASSESVAHPAYPLGETLVQYAGVRGSVWPEPRSLAGPVWTLGYGLERHAVHYFGPQPLPVPRVSNADLVRVEHGDDPLQPDTAYTAWSDALVVASFWGERTWTAGDRLSVRAGGRLEGPTAVRNGGAARLAPRVSIRFSPAPEVALSAGLARVHQYTQAVAPAGVHLASLVSTDVWVVASDAVPAITADHATAGVEAWVARGRNVTLNTFARRSTGVVLPSPQPGPLFDRSRTLVEGENRAYGIEASVRQLEGPVTGSVSYSLSRSRTTASGRELVSSADRTHVFNATAMTRPRPSLRIGAAFTAATGVPFTHTASTAEECAALPGCDPERLPWAGEPNTSRGPHFASLDLLVDWSTELRGFQLGVYGQLRNALGRENATVYTGTGTGCLAIGCSLDELRSAYERGVPRLPVVGLRVRR